MAAPVALRWYHVVTWIVAGGMAYRYFVLLSQKVTDDEIISWIEEDGNGKNRTVKIPARRVFSDSYWQARDRFRKAVQLWSDEVGGDEPARTYSLPVARANRWEKDKNSTSPVLTMEIAVLPGKQKDHGWVLHTAGCHGIEGYTGSAIQLSWLRKLASSRERPLTTTILVHVLNPFGMHHWRRFNEENVDLNRNGLSNHEELVRTHFNHETYGKFDKAFNPQRPPTTFDAMLHSWVQIVINIAMNGVVPLKAAMVGGQHNTPRGIFYGGNKLQNTYHVLEEWLTKEFLPQQVTHVSSSPTLPITLVDVHSGLGPLGQDTLIQSKSHRHGSEEFIKENDDIKATFTGAWAAAPYGSSSNDVTDGYAGSGGFLVDYFTHAIKKHYAKQKEKVFGETMTDTDLPLGVSQEFGTIPVVLVGHALILENAAYHFFDRHQDHLAWAQWTVGRAFYPQSIFWRSEVVQRGVRVIDQAIQRSYRLGIQSAASAKAVDSVIESQSLDNEQQPERQSSVDTTAEVQENEIDQTQKDEL